MDLVPFVLGVVCSIHLFITGGLNKIHLLAVDTLLNLIVFLMLFL